MFPWEVLSYIEELGYWMLNTGIDLLMYTGAHKIRCDIDVQFIHSSCDACMDVMCAANFFKVYLYFCTVSSVVAQTLFCFVLSSHSDPSTTFPNITSHNTIFRLVKFHLK